MGRQKASRLILAGDRMSAQELESAGLISQIFPKSRFMEEVLTIAHRICAMPSEALAANKQLLARFSKSQLHEANDLETEMFSQLLQGEEPKRRVEIFKQEQELKRNGNGSPQRL